MNKHNEALLNHKPVALGMPDVSYVIPYNQDRFVMKQMFLAKGVLDTLRSIDTKAIIAGGAARDWFNNTLAKDVDIFFHLPISASCNAESAQVTLKILESIFPKMKIKLLNHPLNSTRANTEFTDDAFLNYTQNPLVQHVFEFTHRGLVFQLIAMQTPTLNIDNFAYNICQAWSDGVAIWTTSLFKLGNKQNLLIQVGDLYGYQQKYRTKMLQRFHHWNILEVVPVQQKGDSFDLLFSNAIAAPSTGFFGQHKMQLRTCRDALREVEEAGLTKMKEIPAF